MNSLTANNRLSQQLVVSVAEHLLLRHECRLPNHLAVSNHRELYLTVGGELCRNLTAGFVTEEGFMSMLFVGSQKHSALSIFAKTTRMSALVLCGNSGVILLSVKDHQHIDSAIPGRYTVQAPYKAGAGIGVLELIKAIYDAPASFLSSAFAHIKVMVGWAGASKDAPVSLITGYANPVQFTTSEIGVSGGSVTCYLKEAATCWLLPLPKNRNLSGLSPQFAAIARQLPPKFIILLPSLNAMLAVLWCAITSAFLLVVSAWRWHMIKTYDVHMDPLERTSQIITLTEVINDILVSNSPSRDERLKALLAILDLAVRDVHFLLEGGQMPGKTGATNE